MKTLLLVLGFSLAYPLYADQADRQNVSLRPYRQSLREARQNYRQAVQTHGPHSREALDARTQLRASRRTFHAHRRAAQL